ncbi:ubiquitin thioesterase trabid [Culicoides brevitarsis]|uniref:ubiquitin thioesterase trabid n=1 Tax=Culicoides brevitarsis TaxID=469753 RepID=UPI00307C6D58
MGDDSGVNCATEEKKWKCELCTYENCAKNLKCCMCQNKKNLLNEDIFRLSPSSNRPNQQSSPPSLVDSSSTTACGPFFQQQTDADANKWSCTTCTYLNWVRASRCMQCGTKKTAEQEKDNITVNDQLKSLKIRDLDATDDNSRASSPGFGQCVGGAKMSPVSENNQQQQTLSRSSSSNYNFNKWLCPMCTYENWPKSLRCSMCNHQREVSGTPQGAACRAITSAGGGSDTEGAAMARSHTLSPDREIIYDENCAGNFITSNQATGVQKRGTRNCNENAANHDVHQQVERRIRQIRRQTDRQWLSACIGVVENNRNVVEEYLACGGNPARALTANECSFLNRNSAFDVGHTLIHLAIRFHRDEMLPSLLARISNGPNQSYVKRVPSYIAPDIASDIRRHFASSLRIKKAPFNCYYVNEFVTFALPAEIEELPNSIQEQLYDELLDRDAQQQLESPPPALNWSLEITTRFGSRLWVLWNRSAGDCLLDSAMQATYGVFDRDNVLRRALSDTLHQCGHMFYPRWKEYEMIQAALLHFTLEETQWEEDWSTLLSLASQPGSSLEQLHIFTLAHILRRPIIVYGVKYVKSFRGEDLGYARFEGLYLPLLWDQSFCIRSPITLGYTRGHFSALVPMEPYPNRIDSARCVNSDQDGVTFLPLMDCEMKLLPIHFLTQAEMGREEAIMREWLDVCFTDGHLLVAQQKLHKRPLLLAQMLEEWLNHYRRLAQVYQGPFNRIEKLRGYSSDGDSDEE